MSNPYVSGPPGPSLISPNMSVSNMGRRSGRYGRKSDYMLIDEAPDYFGEDYLVPPANNRAVAQVPPPKDTHYHFNEDPSLGGETWRVPVPRAPISDFTKSCSRTPGSTDFERIIPWDHKKKDFVYGAVHDHIFRGRFDRRRLKRRIDHVKGFGGWDPVSGYQGCYLCCLCLGAGVLIFWLLMYLYKPYDWFGWYLNEWWWWILGPLFTIMILITYCCIVVAASNHATRNRYRYLRHACSDINDRHLAGSGVFVMPGQKGAWLQVNMDPRRSDIVGGVIPDRRFYRGQEEVVQRMQHVTIRREEEDAKSMIPIEGRPKRNYHSDLIDDPIDYNTAEVIEETISRGPKSGAIYNDSVSRVSRTNGGLRGSGTVITNSAVSAKKMSFYEKLKASKRSPHQVKGQATPVKSNYASVNSISKANVSHYKSSPRNSRSPARVPSRSPTRKAPARAPSRSPARRTPGRAPSRSPARRTPGRAGSRSPAMSRSRSPMNNSKQFYDKLSQMKSMRSSGISNN